MNKPDWENRNTESLSGWINELATLADHPQIREIWIRQALGVIARGLSRFAEPAQPVALSTLTDIRAILYQCDRGNVSLSWLIDALRGIVERAASVQVQPVGEEGDRLIALAEKCSAEVGRHEGDVVWVKFHSRSSVEAFAAGIVMSAAVRAHAAASAPAQQATPPQPVAAEVAPEWDGWCDAHRFLADIEIAQGGRNGPTIRLGGQLQKLRAQIAEEKSADSRDAQRYRFLRRDAGIHNGRPFIAISSAGGISQWTGIHADKQIDDAMAGTGSDESKKGEA